MDPKKYSDLQIKVAGTTKVLVKTEHLDPDYQIVPSSDTAASATGWVIVAKLIPSNTMSPAFYMRWDKKELDIDIYLSGNNRKDLWDQHGYEGHHSVLVNPDTREYAIDIQVPNKPVFKGSIQVGLVTGLNLHETISLSEHVVIQIK